MVQVFETAAGQGFREPVYDDQGEVIAAQAKAVVGNGDFSTAAKNVKIITVGGVVTLRGPVKSANEKQNAKNCQSREASVGSRKYLAYSPI